MGMYDNVYVPYDIKCSGCGKKLEGWQSKDNLCRLDTVGMGDVENFYTSCPCGIWTEFTKKTSIKKEPTPAPLDDFERVDRTYHR